MAYLLILGLGVVVSFAVSWAIRSLPGNEFFLSGYWGCHRPRGPMCHSCHFYQPRLDRFLTLLIPVVFLAIFHGYGLTPFSIFLLFFVAVAIVVAVIDFQWLIIPDIIAIGGQWGGLMYHLACWPYFRDQPLGLKPTFLLSPWESVGGWMLGGGLFWLLGWAIEKWHGGEGVGFGDVKLIAAMGAWIGPVPLIRALFLASLLALACHFFRLLLDHFRRLTRLFLRRRTAMAPATPRGKLLRALLPPLALGDSLPFGPFLSLGFLLSYTSSFGPASP